MRVVPEERLQGVLEQFLWKYPPPERIALVCLIMAAVAASTWIILGRKWRGYRVTAVYWLACASALLATLHLPPKWILPPVALAIALVSFLFTWLPIRGSHRRRNRAWPNHLDDLAVRYVPPAGLITSMTALSLIVFFLALCHITSLYAVVCALMMGVSLLMLVEHDFHLEAAFAGMILVSEAFVCAFLMITHWITGSVLSVPTIVNLIVILMGVFAWFWIWLGRVWRQQILDGQPLTTAGRMVMLTVHAGVMMLGFGSLLLVKLSLWPKIRVVHSLDNAPSRLVLLAVAAALLLASNAWITVKLKSRLLGYLLMLNLGALVFAYILRWPELQYTAVWPYWPAWMVAAGVLALIAARLLRHYDLKDLASPANAFAMWFCPAVLLWGNVRGGFTNGKLLALAAALTVALVAWRLQQSNLAVDHRPD